MTVLPEPTPTATAAGQAANPLTDAVISAAVDHAIEKARRQGTSPKVVIGNAPPVAQPGIPPMSSKATDASVMMVAGGFLSLCLGAAASAVLYFSHSANETVVIAICATPPAAFLSLKGLVKSVKRAASGLTINNYEGPVYQDRREQRTENRGVWVKNSNRQ